MMANNQKEIASYPFYIVDMDGTLYYKRPMQIQMAMKLVGYYGLHIHRLPELMALKAYRKLRDREELADKDDRETWILQVLADKYHLSVERTQKVITDWIMNRPLKTLFACRDKQLLDFLQMRKAQGARVFIYSDYPAEDKCEALQLQVDGVYWPDGECIMVLKPEAQGLEYILRCNDLDRSQVLFIGDRAEKDGACAEQMGVDYMILKKSRRARRKQYAAILERK